MTENNADVVKEIKAALEKGDSDTAIELANRLKGMVSDAARFTKIMSEEVVVTPALQAALDAPKPKAKFCPECGASVVVGKRFCSECGAAQA